MRIKVKVENVINNFSLKEIKFFENKTKYEIIINSIIIDSFLNT